MKRPLIPFAGQRIFYCLDDIFFFKNGKKPISRFFSPKVQDICFYSFLDQVLRRRRTKEMGGSALEYPLSCLKNSIFLPKIQPFPIRRISRTTRRGRPRRLWRAIAKSI